MVRAIKTSGTLMVQKTVFWHVSLTEPLSFSCVVQSSRAGYKITSTQYKADLIRWSPVSVDFTGCCGWPFMDRTHIYCKMCSCTSKFVAYCLKQKCAALFLTQILNTHKEVKRKSHSREFLTVAYLLGKENEWRSMIMTEN